MFPIAFDMTMPAMFVETGPMVAFAGDFAAHEGHVIESLYPINTCPS